MRDASDNSSNLSHVIEIWKSAMIDRHEALEHHVHQTMMKSSMNPIEQKIFHEKRNENMFRHRSYCRKVGCARLHADFVHGKFVEDECEERMRDEMI